MKKLSILAVAIFCFLGISELSAVPKLGNSINKVDTSKKNEVTDVSASITTTSKSENETEETEKNIKDYEKKTGLATLPNGKAYVGVFSYLSLREEPFGEVIDNLKNNEEVIIVGRDGDWYEVETEKGTGWIYGKCVYDSPNSRKSLVASSSSDVSDTASSTIRVLTSRTTYTYFVPAKSSAKASTSNTKTTKKTKKKKDKKEKSNGKLQDKIVKAAQNLVKKYSKSGSFPYAAATNGGRLGCAQVATTVLKNAGALNTTNLSCVGTMDLLQKAGWKKAKVPPYKAGDVIFWQGTQKKSGPTHVGIIMENGKNVQAMSNSSSQKKPRYHNANYASLYCVMRKA